MAINRIARLIQRIRTRSERGAAAVEFAIGGGLLAVMAFGSAEYGLTLQKTHTLASAVRQASRVASTPCQPGSDCKMGNRPYDDFYILRAAEAAMGEYWGEVRRVVIYKVVGNSQVKGDGGPPAECMTSATGQAIPNASPRAVFCNVYTKDTTFELVSSPGTSLPLLKNLTRFELSNGADDIPQLKATFGDGDNCGAAPRLSRFFCPTSPPGNSTLRPRSLRNPSRVGVFIDVDHKFVTGMFGNGRALAQWSAFALEPHPDDNSTDAATTGTTTSGPAQYDLKARFSSSPNREFQPGDTVSYTLEITNMGLQKVNNATVTSFANALTGVTWTCVSSGGATCPSASGTSTELGPITLPATPTAMTTYTITGTLDPAYPATTLVKKAHVYMPPGITDGNEGDNEAVHLDNVSRPDLAITKDNGVTSVYPGQQDVTYTIVATNAGPGVATNARISDDIDDTLVENIQWSCVGSNGATCPAASGTTDINQTVTLPENGILTYTVQVDVRANAVSPLPIGLTNTARIDPAPGRLDPNMGNNESTDVDEVTKPQLTVAKAISGSAIAGSPVTWTVTVTNGSTPLTGVSFADAIPTFGAVSPFTTGATTGGTFTCAVTVPGTGIATTCPAGGSLPLAATGNMGAGGQVTFTITAELPSNASGTVTNRATAVTPAPWNESFDSTIVNTAITKPNLRMTVTASPSSGSTIAPNTLITYTVRAQLLTAGARVNGAIMRYNASGLPGLNWSCVPSTGLSCPINPTGLSGSSILTFSRDGTLTFTATGTPTALGTVSHNATIEMPGVTAIGQNETNTGSSPLWDNSSTSTHTVSLPRVRLTKVLTAPSDPDVSPGQTGITYRLTMVNDGPGTATNIQIVDSKNSGLSSWSWTCSAGTGATCPSGTSTAQTGNINHTVPSLASGATATFNVTAVVSSSAAINSTIANTVSSPTTAGLAGPITTPPAVNIYVRAPDLVAVSKTVSTTSNVGPGTVLTYTVNVRNDGPGTASGATIRDQLDSSLINSSWTCTASTGSSCVTPSAFPTPTNAAAGALVSQTVNLANGGTARLVITATVKSGVAAGYKINNTGEVFSPTDPVTNSNNKIISPQISVVVPTFTLAKTASVSTIGKGRTMSFTITAGNSGGGVVTALVTDAMPLGANAFASTPVPSWTCTGTCPATSGTGNISQTVTLGPSQTARYVYTGTVSNTAAAGSVITNTAVSGSLSRPASVTVVAPDITVVSKTDGKTVAAPGQTTAYDIVVKNNGPGDITNGTFTDAIPSSITGIVWTCTPSTGSTCPSLSGSPSSAPITNLKDGGTLTLRASGTISTTATGTLTNTATAATPTDSNTSNNAKTDTTTIQRPDLSITKDNGTATVAPGSVVTWSIVATNNGPGNVVGAKVTDTPDARLTSVNWTCAAGSGATCPASSGTGGLNHTFNLNEGSSTTFTFKGTLPVTATGTLSNTAAIAPPATSSDPNMTNNSWTDGPDTILGPDLDIKKTVSTTSVNVGSPLTYTIVVKNIGPAPTTGARVTDTLPSQLGGASWTCVGSAGGVCGSGSGTGNINATTGAMPVGGIVTYTVTGTVPVTATGPISNTANVATSGSTVVDPNTSNNSSTAPNVAVVTPDLSVTIASASGSYVTGTPLSYIVVATNNGPAALTGVNLKVGSGLTASSPIALLTGVSWSCAPSCGSGTGNTFNQTINLNSGQSFTYTITGTIPATAAANLAFTTHAVIAAPSGVTDRNLVNNTDNEVDAITRPASTGGGTPDGS
jgi:uncharacterized repeat protein (TIGR01451 family)